MSIIKAFCDMCGKKPDVKDMESLEVNLEVDIPRNISRELYDQAVSEVQVQKISDLILTDLLTIFQESPLMKETEAAIRDDFFNPSLGIAPGYLKYFKSAYPNANFSPVRVQGFTPIPHPEPTLTNLSKVLAHQYMNMD